MRKYDLTVFVVTKTQDSFFHKPVITFLYLPAAWNPENIEWYAENHRIRTVGVEINGQMQWVDPSACLDSPNGALFPFGEVLAWELSNREKAEDFCPSDESLRDAYEARREAGKEEPEPKPRKDIMSLLKAKMKEAGYTTFRISHGDQGFGPSINVEQYIMEPQHGTFSNGTMCSEPALWKVCRDLGISCGAGSTLSHQIKHFDGIQYGTFKTGR